VSRAARVIRLVGLLWVTSPVTRLFKPCLRLKLWQNFAGPGLSTSNIASTGWKPVSRAARVIRLVALLWVAFGALSASPLEQVFSPPTSAPSHFAWVDAWIDPHGQPLGAYQFELKSSGAGVTLVGVEGGEHPAFAQPPYYDPKANLKKSIIIAAYNTSSDLPRTRTRVARIMVRISGSVEPNFSATLDVAASNESKPIDAAVSVSEGAAQ
jgi:hypothetical protein